jgi:hypothetical protein
MFNDETITILHIRMLHAVRGEANDYEARPPERLLAADHLAQVGGHMGGARGCRPHRVRAPVDATGVLHDLEPCLVSRCEL